MEDIYTFTIPIFIKTLGGLRAVMRKAQEHARTIRMPEELLLSDRIAADMFPLMKQVQIACESAVNAAGRLAGEKVVQSQKDDATFDDLYAHIDAAIEFLQEMPSSRFVGANIRQITLPYLPEGVYLTGFDYAREYAVPIFFFHTTMAYALVRKNGVPVGRGDYLNDLPLRSLSNVHSSSNV